jgi:exodeoxyribonuclease V beta subunit
LNPADLKLAGTSLIEASAGTGKTQTITTIFLRLVLEHGVSVREIVVVTFTDAAASELRGRIRRRLAEALETFDDPARAPDDDVRAVVARYPDRSEGRRRVQVAMSELDMAAISTIHSFCQRALKERAFETGSRFDVELAPDTSQIVREIAEDYWSGRMVPLAADLYRLVQQSATRKMSGELVKLIARRPPDMPVLPDVIPEDPEGLRQELGKAYRAARVTWTKAGKDVRKLVLETNALSRDKKSGYPPEKVEAWCEDLDAFFESKDASFTLREGIVMFSESVLIEHTVYSRPAPVHRFFKQADAVYGLSRSAADSLVRRFKRQLVDYSRAQMADRKAALGVQGYEDLLFGLDRALAGERQEPLVRALRGQFKAALVDEFQDTDPVQFRIFRRIFHGHATLILVGDPKQSIYSFRGADIFSYLEAARDAGESAHTLDTNYRSDPSLVRAVSTIFARVQKPFVLDELEFHPVKAHEKVGRPVLSKGAAFEILLLPPAEKKAAHDKGQVRSGLAALIAKEIARFLTSGTKIGKDPVRAGDIAVLTRTNEQARQTQVALRSLGIPTALESETSVFTSPEASELEQVLRAILEPTRSPLVRTALATSIVGLSAEEIVALDADEQGWQDRSDSFRALREVWAQQGFVQVFHELLRSFAVEPRLLSYVDGERRVTNLIHLRDVLHDAARRERLAPSGLVRWLAATRASPAETGAAGSDAVELRLESDAHAVKLLTIHKSKGLQYPIVYCPFLWDASPRTDRECLAFHDPADNLALKLHLAPEDVPEVVAAAERESRAEQQRLLYVALTRAKHRCSLVWGAIHATDESCLRYTLHPGRPDDSSLSDAELRSDIDALVKAAKGAIVARDLADAPASPYVDKERSIEVLGARKYDRRVDHWWRVGSFSALSGRKAASEPEAEGRDRDEVDEAEIARTTDRSARPEPTDPDEEAAPGPPVILHDFPRGTRAGTLLHKILEEYDFATPDRSALPTLVHSKLPAYGYAPEKLAATLTAGIEALLDTPLGIGTCLRQVTRGRRVDELEFLLPAPQDSKSQLTAKAISAVFAKHRTELVPAGYVDQVRRLGFLPLRGFLRGFVDLVFEHDGRFYVVDYKSNHLGDTAGSYAPTLLGGAMAHANYFLQYHLYAVAVDRWLRRRMRDYDYDRSFGGVLYLFARGMSPAHPERTGIFFDRPHREMIDGLSGVIDHG